MKSAVGWVPTPQSVDFETKVDLETNDDVETKVDVELTVLQTDRLLYHSA